MESGDVNDCVQIKKIRKDVSSQPWTLEDAPVVLTARARRIPEWVIEDDMAAELQPSPAYSECETEEIELIPLGCARLRMSCLPVVTEDGEKGVRWTAVPSHTEPSTRVQKHDWPYPMPKEN